MSTAPRCNKSAALLPKYEYEQVYTIAESCAGSITNKHSQCCDLSQQQDSVSAAPQKKEEESSKMQRKEDVSHLFFSCADFLKVLFVDLLTNLKVMLPVLVVFNQLQSHRWAGAALLLKRRRVWCVLNVRNVNLRIYESKYLRVMQKASDAPSCQKGDSKSAPRLLIYMNTTSAVLLHPPRREQGRLKQRNSQTKTKMAPSFVRLPALLQRHNTSP